MGRRILSPKQIGKTITKNIRGKGAITIVLSLAFLMLLHFTAGSNPSGNNWSYDGGGFCPVTYRIFNNTGVAGADQKVYAENCLTGTNDNSTGTDVGGLVTSLINHNLPSGGAIQFGYGMFMETTPINFNNHGGITLEGQGPGSTPFNSPLATNPSNNDTILVSKTSSLTMIESSANTGTVSCPNGSGCTGTNALPIPDVTIRDLGLDGNCKGGVGIDFRFTEAGGVNDQFDHLRLGSGCGSTTFSTAMFLWGAEDSSVQRLITDGAGTVATGGATVDLDYREPVGDVKVAFSYFGGVTNLQLAAQTAMIMMCTVSSVKFMGTEGATYFTNNYIINNQGTGRVQLNGQTVDLVSFNGDGIELDSTRSFIVGSGTLSNLSMAATDWQFKAGATWTSGAPTLTLQISQGANPPTTGATTPGTNHVFSSAGTPTGFPFTITSSNF